MNDIITEQVGLKLACGNVLTCTHALLTNLNSLDAVGKEKCGLYLREVETEQVTFEFQYIWICDEDMLLGVMIYWHSL